MTVCRVVCGIVVACLALVRPAFAEPVRDAADDESSLQKEKLPHKGGQRQFGFGPAVGVYNGVGGLVTMQAAPLGFVVGGGWQPILIFGNEGLNREMTIDYYSSAQLNADLLIGPIYGGRVADVSLLAGYRYDTLLGHGFGVGARVALDLSRELRAELYYTPHIFPSASDRLREHGYPDGRDPAIPWLQGGLGAALVYYP